VHRPSLRRRIDSGAGGRRREREGSAGRPSLAIFVRPQAEVFAVPSHSHGTVCPSAIRLAALVAERDRGMPEEEQFLLLVHVVGEDREPLPAGRRSVEWLGAEHEPDG
jgi:hypothetical protein